MELFFSEAEANSDITNGETLEFLQLLIKNSAINCKIAHTAFFNNSEWLFYGISVSIKYAYNSVKNFPLFEI